MSQWDVVIIGAGMSGLAAGIRLAHFEKKVLILERHNVLGGLNSFYKQAGRKFDVGLHAMTNYVPPGTRGAPLTKLLRQLRIRHEELGLFPQTTSDIRFPGAALTFSNDFELLRSQVAERFPGEIDGFDRLAARIRADEEATSLSAETVTARQVLPDFLREPLLVEMILAPCFFYGSAREDDMDWGQFVIMFRSLFFEGFARPWGGVREILQILRKKFLAAGGVLRMKAGVRRIMVRGGRARSVELDDGEVLECGGVLSSAGHLETLRMLSDFREGDELPPAGKLSFVESIAILDREPRDLGYDKCITFFCLDERLAYRRPEDRIDTRSGVICAPNNYAHDRTLPEGVIRFTSLANYDRWVELDEAAYRAAKQEAFEAQVRDVETVIPPFRSHVTYIDTFTPRTVTRFTSHLGGAIYGAPNKVKDGRTHVENLFLCGTDQGFLGITGAMLSGISMANAHLLK